MRWKCINRSLYRNNKNRNRGSLQRGRSSCSLVHTVCIPYLTWKVRVSRKGERGRHWKWQVRELLPEQEWQRMVKVLKNGFVSFIKKLWMGIGVASNPEVWEDSWGYRSGILQAVARKDCHSRGTCCHFLQSKLLQTSKSTCRSLFCTGE